MVENELFNILPVAVSSKFGGTRNLLADEVFECHHLSIRRDVLVEWLPDLIPFGATSGIP